MPKIRPSHYLLGIQGLALVRNWMRRGEQAVAPRVRELTRMVTELESSPLNTPLEVPEMDVADGYGAWAPKYDGGGNPLLIAEEPIVHGYIDRIAPGKALDAACGTGRHTQYLRARGHQVIGVDMAPAMLGVARAKVPEAGYCIGSLFALPFASDSFDLVVCSLALDHVPQLAPPIAEMARVLRHGGWAIISDFHPTNSMLGGGAFFQGADGRLGIVRGFSHDHAEYISAFVAAGFEIRECAEPRWGEREIAMNRLFAMAPEAYREALIDLPLALVWMLSRR